MKAIVYTSNTGFTARYAQLLGEKTGLPVYELSDALQKLGKGSSVIYMGWIFASTVKGYRKAAERFSVKCLCGVGMCDTGTLLDDVRKVNELPDALPVFTLQGGMDHSRLKGINRFMIRALIWYMSLPKKLSQDDLRKLELIREGGDYVSEENLTAVLDWYKEAK